MRRYFLEHPAFGGSRLASASGKGHGVELIELFEPVRGVWTHRFQQYSLRHPANAHTIPLKAELLRQTHRLAAAVLEELGSIGLRHGLSIYQKYISIGLESNLRHLFQFC